MGTSNLLKRVLHSWPFLLRLICPWRQSTLGRTDAVDNTDIAPTIWIPLTASALLWYLDTSIWNNHCACQCLLQCLGSDFFNRPSANLFSNCNSVKLMIEPSAHLILICRMAGVESPRRRQFAPKASQRMHFVLQVLCSLCEKYSYFFNLTDISFVI